MIWHKIGEIYKRSNSIKVKHPSESCLCIWRYLYPKHFWSCLIACLPACHVGVWLYFCWTCCTRIDPDPIQSDPIRANSQISASCAFPICNTTARSMQKHDYCLIVKLFPCWPNPKLDLYDCGLVPRSDNQQRSHLGMKVLASPSLILGITTLICGYACYIWWQLWPLISPSTNLSCSG